MPAKDLRWGTRKNKLPTYNVWVGMKARCYNKNSEKYPSYGARGIKVCDRWVDSFNNFYDDMFSGYKKGLTLDRIDNNGNYCKENCRWATHKEQANNTRRNRLIYFNGKNQTITDWAREMKVSHSFLQKRLKLGWKIRDIFTKPNRFAIS